jgi:class 3 adenylate cyclase
VPLRRFLHVLGEVSALFDAAPLNVLRQTLGPRLPAGAGLAIGVDAGQVSIWPMAGQPELQGEPVITATRMQSVAEAGEIVVAPHLSQTIEHDRVRALPHGMTLSRTRRHPKNHEEGVDIYVLRYMRRPRFSPEGQVLVWEDIAGVP